MKSYSDLMIDLETYGTKPGCVILEIGLVAFDRNKPDRLPQMLSIFPDITEQQSMGFVIENDTMRFWMEHRDAWERQLKADRVSVAVAAAGVTKFWRDYCREESLLWAKGTPFDFPILRTIHEDPWSFRRVHDLRTLQLIAPDVTIPRSEFAHGAVQDAACQAKGVQLICSTIGMGF